MPVVADPALLGGVPMFRGLTDAELSKLNNLLHRKIFPAANMFINAEQPGEAIYIIVSGTVKVFIEDLNGAEVILAILLAGEVVGEMSLLDNSGRSANAIALEETTVFWMDRASFCEALRTIPEINNNLFRLLCNRLRLANERIQSLSVQDVEGRVARQLLAFAKVYGEEDADGGIVIPFRLTQSDLAGLIGATRVRVNQVIASYKQRNYISVDQHYRVTIHNREALSRRNHQSVSRPVRPVMECNLARQSNSLTDGVPNLTSTVLLGR